MEENKTAKKTYNYFSEEDDKVILKQIELYPTNINYSFEESAKLLEGKSIKSIESRYYRILKFKRNVKAITCGSKAGFTQNVKNIMRDGDGNLPPQNLKHYMWVMKEMLDLSPEEREMIVKFFMGPLDITISKRRKKKD